ncbi:hypothetical protein [Streptomyces sp. NBC_00158]|uniref:hypothetical protein n=1 Tax=Streptomyces sp. NBC_00158 TaxID=2903627 RepID=UPI0032500246
MTGRTGSGSGTRTGRPHARSDRPGLLRLDFPWRGGLAADRLADTLAGLPRLIAGR